MDFPSQRDVTNGPAYFNVQSGVSSKLEEGTMANLQNPKQTSFFTDLWGFFRGNNSKDSRVKTGTENSQIQTSKATPESNSGINSRTFNYGESSRPSIKTYFKDHNLFPAPVSNDIQHLLLELQKDGKFTIETVVELMDEYQTYLTGSLTEQKLPEGGHTKFLEYIKAQCAKIIEVITSLQIPEKLIRALVREINSIWPIFQTFLCQSQRENNLLSQKLQKVNYNRQSLQHSLDKLSNVEDKILNLKIQAAKADSLQREVHNLRKQLESYENKNNMLVNYLMETKENQEKLEKRRQTDFEKLTSEIQKWKCRADSVNNKYEQEAMQVKKCRLAVELDRATDRILKGHETKRKLHLAESVRKELERQIQEMIDTINKLNAQIETSKNPSTLTNLLTQSRNTLKNVLKNVNKNNFTSQPFPKDIYVESSSEKSKLELENIKLTNEIRGQTEQIENLRKQLEHWKVISETNRCNCKEIARLQEEVKIFRLENINLKEQIAFSQNGSQKLTREVASLRQQLNKRRVDSSQLENTMPTLVNEQEGSLPQGAANSFNLTKCNQQTEKGLKNQGDRQKVGPQNENSENELKNSSDEFVQKSEMQTSIQEKDKIIQNIENECTSLRVYISKLNKPIQKQISRMESIAGLEKQIEHLKKEFHEQGNLLAWTKEQLKGQKRYIEKHKEMLSCMKQRNSVLIAENLRLQDEKSARDAIKAEKNRRNGNLKNQRKDFGEQETELVSCRQKIEAEEVHHICNIHNLLEQNTRLEAENARLLNELDGLDEVVDAINAERLKSQKLEELIENFDQQLGAINIKAHENISLPPFDLTEKLKQQLEQEISSKKELRLDLSQCTAELEKLRTLNNPKAHDSLQIKTKSSNILLLENEREECKKLVDKLNAQLNSEKTRYNKLHSNFIEFSSKIEQLEKRLREKIEIIVNRHGNRSPTIPLKTHISVKRNIHHLQMKMQQQQAENKKLVDQLVLASMTQENAANEQEDCREKHQESQQERQSEDGSNLYLEKRIQETSVVPKQTNCTQSGSSESQDSPEISNTNTSEQGLQDLNDQLKEQLASEQEKYGKLKAQHISKSLKNEELQNHFKKLRAQVAQLQHILKRRDTTIGELQKRIDELMKTKGVEGKEVHNLKIMSLQNKLRDKLPQDCNKEADNSHQILEKQLADARKEVKIIKKCFEEVEKVKEAFKEKNKELMQQLERYKQLELESAETKDSETSESATKESGEANIIDNTKLGSIIERYPDAVKKQLLHICNEIQKGESLTNQQLTWFNCQIDKIYRYLKISESQPVHCKCREFVANLPPVPKSKEEELMARVGYMETELDNANQVLQHLKKEYAEETRQGRKK